MASSPACPCCGPTFHGPRLGAAPLPAFDAHHLPGVIVVLLVAGVAGSPARRSLRATSALLRRFRASCLHSPPRCCALFIVSENLREKGSSARDVFVKVLVVLVGRLSLLYSALVFCAETGWYSDIYPWAYQMLSRHCKVLDLERCHMNLIIEETYTRT